MIKELTSEQKSKFAEYGERWAKIGLSTESANRSEAEKAINESYQLAGLPSPKKIVWCGSPLSQGLVYAIVLNKKKLIKEVKDSVKNSIKNSVWDSVGDSVGNSVRNSIGSSVRNSVRNSVWDSVGDSVGNSVRNSVRNSVKNSVWDSVGDSVKNSVRNSVKNSVWDSVRNSVWDSVGDSVKNSVRNSVWNSIYGQHEAGWLSYYSFFREVCGLEKETEKLNGLFGVSKNAGWFLPYQNICWVSERHSILNRDDGGRIHSFTEPSIMYPDGWTIYAIHGVLVPEYVVMDPEKITVQDIEKEENAEIRRIKINRYGQDKFLKDSDSVKIHEDDYGTLWKKDLLNDEPIVMVELINSTPEPDNSFKHYFIRVPPTVKTAHEAVGWTFGKTDKNYKPLIMS